MQGPEAYLSLSFEGVWMVIGDSPLNVPEKQDQLLCFIKAVLQLRTRSYSDASLRTAKPVLTLNIQRQSTKLIVRKLTWHPQTQLLHLQSRFV